MEQYKTCPDCSQSKLLNDFHNNRKTKDGKATYCKPCLLARGKAYRQANPEKVKQTNKESKAKNYKKAKASTKRWRENNKEKYLQSKRDSYQRHIDSNRERQRDRYRANPEPYKIRAVEWSKANPEKRYQVTKNWFLKNPGKAAFYQHTRRLRLSTNEVLQIRSSFIKKLYSSPCFYCGSLELIEADHVIPVSRGGRHSEGNLVPACRTCNRSKQALFIMEWRLKR